MKTRVFQDNNAFSQRVSTHSEQLGCGRERRPIGAGGCRCRGPDFGNQLTISQPGPGADYAHYITTAAPPDF